MNIFENVVDTVFSFFIIHLRFFAGAIESYLRMLYRYIQSLVIMWSGDDEEDDDEDYPPPPNDSQPPKKLGGFDLHRREGSDNWFM